jgi:hypothetical protein
LAHEFVTAAARDRSGALWFGTTFGVSRLHPSRDAVRRAPPIWISSLRIDGTLHPVAELGAAQIEGLVLQPGQDAIEMEVGTISAGMGETVRVQYRLADSARGWSPPTLDRRFAFARLARAAIASRSARLPRMAR